MKKKIIGIIICTLLIPVMIPFSVASIETVGKIITVDDDGEADYTKIQDAIDAALIDKSITIIGEDRESTIIDGGNIGNIVILSSDFINFSGFTIKNSDDGGIGIFVKGIYGGLISSNIISDTFILLN